MGNSEITKCKTFPSFVKLINTMLLVYRKHMVTVIRENKIPALMDTEGFLHEQWVKMGGDSALSWVLICMPQVQW